MGQRMMIAIVAAIVVAGIASAQTPASPAAPQSPKVASATEIDLSVEPARANGAKAPATLRAAATANDFRAFDALVRKAKLNGEDLGAFGDLYDVWSFSESTATGAYYGATVHDRLAARYPDYAKYIEDYRVTDSHGQSFYPSAETRNFLLQQAIEGNDPLVATKPHSTQTAAVAKPAASRTIAESRPLQTPLAKQQTTSAAAPIEPPEALPADALASDMNKVEAQAPPATAPKRQLLQAEMTDTAGTTRGIFLVILGLVGIGVVTMTMQASSSEGHVADDEERPQATVTIATAHDARPTESHG